MIGKLDIQVEQLPKTGDRDDYKVTVNGPDPLTHFTVPVTISGTISAIWSQPNGKQTVEELTRTIFGNQLGAMGNATPPQDGFWFDSYNSARTVEATQDFILNKGARSFYKNKSYDLIWGKSLNQEFSELKDKLDQVFLEKFQQSFFRETDQMAELSQISEELEKPPNDNANYVYRICILAGFIDHLNFPKLEGDKHKCNVCNYTCRSYERTLNAFTQWLTDHYGESESIRFTTTFRMVRKLRNQYPIHDTYNVIENEMKIKKGVEEANKYFEISEPKAYSHNFGVILAKFNSSLNDILSLVSGK